MIRIARWKMISTVAVCALGIVFALPNVVSESTRLNLPNWLQKTINLGLELQGGSHLQLEVDMKTVHKDHMQGILDEVRSTLRKHQIGYTNLKVDRIQIQGENESLPKEAVVFALRDASTGEAAKKLLRKIDADWVINIDANGNGTVHLTPESILKRQKLVIDQSIEVVRRRVDESGTKEPIIQAQGKDRIILQLPGVSSPDDVKKLLGKTAKLTFQIVDENAMPSYDENGKPVGQVPPGTELLPEVVRRGNQELITYVPVRKQVMVSGETLIDAQVSMTEHGQPAVSLRFNSVGARKFGEMSKNYLKKRFAIVLDNQVISSPVFQVIIPDGNGQISGNFTIKEANDLALLLRAGALPAPLKVIEERTVGPSLGADSIADGRNATVLAFVMVSIFMIMNYSLFGVFANVALVFNLTLLFAGLSLLQATLTLPGIAAIALTIGMAVDANVLIYERIKEEFRHGLRPAAAIESGYKRAMTTIVDANVTSLIGSAVLFEFGTGPIRGFAVNLALGILISMFTAIALTKLLMSLWFGKKTRKTLPL